MTLEKVTDRVYADVAGENGGNYGAIVLDEEIIMVDAGMMHLKSAIAKEYLADQFGLPINRILLTHHHSDHVLGAQAFEPMSFISSSQTRKICEEALDSRWSDEELKAWAEEARETRPELWESFQTLRVIIPDVTFDEELRFGKDVVFRHIGGHTVGSSVVIVEPEHVLFIGDLLFNESFPYAGDGSCDPDRWISGLEELIAAEYELVIPGHGPLCGSEGIIEQVQFLKRFREVIKGSIEEGITSEQFLNEKRTPDYYLEGAEHRVKISVEHWFAHYGR
ncbi:MAG: MBL fold metallo-hydrolase [Candidatus Thorarchaeota archaeon]|jgi:glyoxylase-like metal-dependent hydrolase (beta-lactamase superfamily II)